MFVLPGANTPPPGLKWKLLTHKTQCYLFAILYYIYGGQQIIKTHFIINIINLENIAFVEFASTSSDVSHWI